MGGTLTKEHEYGEEAEGFPVVRASDTEIPYPRFMNEDAVGEINAADVDLAIIKQTDAGDVAILLVEVQLLPAQTILTPVARLRCVTEQFPNRRVMSG